MIKAVIFDMDGLMVDTEPLWIKVNSELAEKYGVDYPQELITRMMGRKEDEALAIFKDYHKLSVPVEELIKTRKQMLLEQLDLVSVNPGLSELIALLERLGIKKAIATSSFRNFAEKVIDKIGLSGEFRVFITGDQLRNGKPDPEIFLKAAGELAVRPSDCLVLEDAQNGVEAGFRAGMKVIAIPHKDSAHHDFSKATMVLNSLLEVTPELLGSL